MKILITLLNNEHTNDLIESITEKKFKNLTIYVDEKHLEITVTGDFYIESGMNINDVHKLWIVDEEYVYLTINMNDIKRFVIKDIK